MDRQYSGLTEMVLSAVLACSSALTVYSSCGGPAGSAALVLAADAALLVLLCFLRLRQLERADRGFGGRTGGGIAGHYSPLAKMGLAALACDAALAVHDAGAAGSLATACVLLAYAALVAFAWLFIRSLGCRAHEARG